MYTLLQEYLLGLTDRSHLYAGDTEVFLTSLRCSWSDCRALALTCTITSASCSAGLQYFLLRRLWRLSPGHHALPQLPLPPAPHTRSQRCEPFRRRLFRRNLMSLLSCMYAVVRLIEMTFTPQGCRLLWRPAAAEARMTRRCGEWRGDPGL